jgi:hypothetical protein
MNICSVFSLTATRSIRINIVFYFSSRLSDTYCHSTEEKKKKKKREIFLSGCLFLLSVSSIRTDIILVLCQPISMSSTVVDDDIVDEHQGIDFQYFVVQKRHENIKSNHYQYKTFVRCADAFDNSRQLPDRSKTKTMIDEIYCTQE